MKHKSAERAAWARVTARRFQSARLEAGDYAGHLALLHIDAVTAPLIETYHGRSSLVADAGFTWLQQFPDGARHAVTTAFDAQGTPVQWYIDIVRAHGLDARGIPWYDDLYLDIILQPWGEVIVVDQDELDEARGAGLVSEEDYHLAWREVHALLGGIASGAFALPRLSLAHRAWLLARG
jgi:predicted RNA-binding protein associated with RNAse of E/G family